MRARARGHFPCQHKEKTLSVNFALNLAERLPIVGALGDSGNSAGPRHSQKVMNTNQVESADFLAFNEMLDARSALLRKVSVEGKDAFLSAFVMGQVLADAVIDAGFARIDGQNARAEFYRRVTVSLYKRTAEL